jgi:cytochrome c oxidase subunit 2
MSPPRPRHTRSSRAFRRLTPLAPAAIALLSAGCSRGMFDTHGADSDRIDVLWWLMLVLGGAVFIIVMALLAYALFRRRPAGGQTTFDRRPLSSLWFVLVGGAIVPVVILAVVWGYTLKVMASSDTSPEGAMKIDVTGHQWWWEVGYPDQQFSTANEIHIPVGVPVEVHLHSPDVIHSFWVPQLAGKTDAIPGQENVMSLKADAAGTYRGQCAEFCGIAHANMAFLVIAEPQAQFDQWAEAQRKPGFHSTDPTLVEGEQIFLGSACVYCHAVRGTNASGTLGPDLTHLASRTTIGAGALHMNADDLARWITQTQDVKPGNKMPPTKLDQQSLDRLDAYLQSLK